MSEPAGHGSGPCTKLEFRPVAGPGSGDIAVLWLARPDVANALSGAMIQELSAHFETVAGRPSCRALVLGGEGKHFCAGADLGWMKASAELTYEENIADAKKLAAMLEALSALPIPTIAVLHGAVYGGAVGLAACCDIVLAERTTRFCLSEAKIGLLPAIILPYLARRMTWGPLRRHGLSGRVFSADEAAAFGLVDVVGESQDMDPVLHTELAAILSCSPDSQAHFKSLMRETLEKSFAQGDYTAEAIARARVSKAGQAGLAAFFAKQPAPWAADLPADWRRT